MKLIRRTITITEETDKKVFNYLENKKKRSYSVAAEELIEKGLEECKCIKTTK